jgi:tetratricopeptide (TPR) repeat protein
MKQDWFRKTSWSEQDQADFFLRLRRAKRKSRPQYLRVQAITLSDTSPSLGEAAITLLDIVLQQYPDSFEIVPALSAKGKCLEHSGNIDDALGYYSLAVNHMRQKPNIQTSAWLDLVWLVAREMKHKYYDEALGLIDEFGREGLRFPIVEFQIEASRAFILSDRGEPEKAADAARTALSAAAELVSGLTRHPSIGLVGEISPIIQSRLNGIAQRLT